MIALPKNQQGSKIATPHKAVTLKGVLPVSSTRNIMARVQDTKCTAQDAIAVRKYKTKPCKGCGGPVRTTLKKPFCSHECRNKHKPIHGKKTVVFCCVCSKEVVRLVYGDMKKFCCSLDCQRVWAGMCGKGKVTKTDWIARSKKAKLLWKKKHSRIRRKESTNREANWWRLCSSKQHFSRQLLSQWGMRCDSSASCLQQRLVIAATSKRSKKNRTWQKLCRFTVVKKIDYASMEGWVKKCYSVCKNMKWKRRLRNVKQNIWKPTNRVEQGLRQLEFWE